MKGFIEVTDEETNDNVLVNTSVVKEILKTCDGQAFITLGIDAAGGLVGFYTKDTYIEIKHKIRKLEEKL